MLLTEMRSMGPTPPRGWGSITGFTEEVMPKPGMTGTSRDTASQAEDTSAVRHRLEGASSEEKRDHRALVRSVGKETGKMGSG